MQRWGTSRYEARLSSHYRILPLKLGSSLFVESDALRVDLDAVDIRAVVSNDSAFISARRPGTFFWVSGGGTYLINNKYLLIVKRSLASLVNGGLYSLFTGRADTEEELLNPHRMVRELFEELVLFSGKKLCYPIFKDYQPIIDALYAKRRNLMELRNREAMPLYLTYPHDFDKSISVQWRGRSQEFSLNFHVNSRHDINVLFLLAAELNVADLTALDFEYLLEEGDQHHSRRDIFLYEPITSMARSLSGANRSLGNQEMIDDGSMTEHLQYLVQLVRAGLSGAPASVVHSGPTMV